MNVLKMQIEELAKKSLIDEIRFIDAAPLTEEHIGIAGLFKNRQPQAIMPAANSILLFSTYIGKYLSPQAAEYGQMSRLVLSGFYANVVEPLAPIEEFLAAQGYQALIMDGAGSLDSPPLKAAAVKAGLGWIGKNTLLINEHYGSFQAIGAILTDAVLHEEYAPAPNRCGKCTKCMTACPANALQTPQHLERLRCLSHILDGDPGEISLNDVDLQGFFFECDICQNACPWNQRHLKQPLKTPYGDLYHPKMVEPLLRIDRLEAMDQETYDRELVPWMGACPIPYDVFKRNVEAVKRTLSPECVHNTAKP